LYWDAHSYYKIEELIRISFQPLIELNLYHLLVFEAKKYEYFWL